MEERCHDTGLGNDILDMTSKAQATKEKNKPDFTKINNFWAQRKILSSKNTLPSKVFLQS